MQNKPNLFIVKDAFSQIRCLVESKMRGAALDLVQNLFHEEVERLCGKPFQRKHSELYFRGGSDPGSILIQGKRLSVKKPRIKSDDGEVHLESYNALQSYDLLCDRVMNHMLSGVSTRNYEPLIDEISGGLGLKKSAVSEAFVKESREILDEINSRNLADLDICFILIDGIAFGERLVVVAIGINSKGQKYVLGLREGSTEDGEVCKDLLSSLIERGLSKERSYLFVIDGGKGLRSAINVMFKKSLVQRCSVHKLRNIKSYLDKQYHRELNRRWRTLHGHAHYSAALEDYQKLLEWLSNINHEAASSLEEAKMETLTVVKLKVPGLLRKSLHSTNIIESVFSKVRSKTDRVKNWRTSTDQISRWAAAALMTSEKTFMTLKGFKQIPMIMNELNKHLEKEERIA